MSNIAQFKQQQRIQEEAARQGLHGFASVASHDVIEARMERQARAILCLIDEGNHEAARTLLQTDAWGFAESDKTSYRTPVEKG